jgi:hypothetical protein
MPFLAERLLFYSFLGDDRDFPESGVKTYLMALVSPRNSSTFFLVCTSIVYETAYLRRHLWSAPQVNS